MFNLFRKPIRPSLRKQEVVARTYRIGLSEYTEKELQEIAVLLKRGISPWPVRVPTYLADHRPSPDANGYYPILSAPAEGTWIEVTVGPMGDIMPIFEFRNGTWVIMKPDNSDRCSYRCGNDITPALIPCINRNTVTYP